MALSPVPEATDLALPSPRPAVEPPGETAELAEAREQLREALETIEAIRGGGIDSLVIGPPGQEQVYSVASADRTYRLIVNAMSEGAATVSPPRSDPGRQPATGPDDRECCRAPDRHRHA